MKTKIDSNVWIWNERNPTYVDRAEWLSTLIDTFILMSNNIFLKTTCAEGDTILAGEYVLSIIQELPEFELCDNHIYSQKSLLVGRLLDRWDVYFNPELTENKFIISYSNIAKVPEKYKSDCTLVGTVINREKYQLEKYDDFIKSDLCDLCGSQRCDKSMECVSKCEKYKRFLACDKILDDLKTTYENRKGNRISKDDYYLGIAEAVLQRSTCLRRKYGVVIVQNDVIVSTGYNGSPRGMKNCCDVGHCEREQHNVPKGERYELCVAIHAEDNAITAAGRDKCLGATLYICGKEINGSYAKPDPCLMCNRKIINAGIKKVIGRGIDGSIVEIPIKLS